MPQGQGYSTVLRGANGGPAVDHETGQQLTIEELLRRRGFVPYFNNPPATLPDGTPPSPSGPVVSSFPTGSGGQLGGASSRTNPSNVAALDASASDASPSFVNNHEVQMAANSLPEEDKNGFWELALGAGAASALWFLISRLNRNGIPVSPTIAEAASTYSAGAGGGSAMGAGANSTYYQPNWQFGSNLDEAGMMQPAGNQNPYGPYRNIMDAEWTDVPQGLPSPQQSAGFLPAPPQSLPNETGAKLTGPAPPIPGERLRRARVQKMNAGRTQRGQGTIPLQADNQAIKLPDNSTRPPRKGDKLANTLRRLRGARK